MKPILIASFLFLSNILSAQTDTTIFNAMYKVETTEYIFSVPERWKYVIPIDAGTKDKKFEFTNVALPLEVAHTPLVAIFTLRKYECRQVKEAEDYIVGEFTSYPDRITPAGYNYETDSLQILSGEKAVLFSTHFYRRSKALNYTRYDMVVYSKKRKAAYMLTATYQYRDFTYAIETNLRFKEYALRVFKTLLLR